MKIDNKLCDILTARAKVNPRLRQSFDLRNTPDDDSQRMLNAMEPGTKVPIHRHAKSTETVVVVRGKLRQNYYRLETDPQGNMVAELEESFICEVGGNIPGFSVEVGRWHNSEPLVSGTVILECKDGKYNPLGVDDIFGQ